MMNDAIENALNEYAASGVIHFEVESGDDSFDYEYGSIRGTHGGKYCNVGCGENEIELTVALDADEIAADAVGTKGKLTIEMDSDYCNTNVDVEFEWTVKSVNVEEGTVTLQFNYWGCADVEGDDDYDGPDYDYDYGPY